MKCFVYRSSKKAGIYIYLNQKDNFEKIPNQLLKLFGIPKLALEFDLTENRKLVIGDAKQVMVKLKEQGYYLQMPPENNLPD